MNTEYPVSPYVKVDGIVYFARMLSKIRLHAAGKLADDYTPHLGGGFDGRCLQFLHLNYEELKQRALADGSDAEVLQWAYEHGRGCRPCEDEIYGWNSFMVKTGWRDMASERLAQRLKENNLVDYKTKIETFFDFIEADEKRVPPQKWWE